MQDAAPFPTDNLDWITELPIETIAAIATAAQSALASKKRAEEERLWAQFKEQAEKLGIDPANFAAAKIGKAGRGISRLPPKYKNPATGETWNGRGLGNPKWLDELIEAGHQKDDFISEDWKQAKGIE